MQCLNKCCNIANFSTPNKLSLRNEPFLMNKQESSSWIKTVLWVFETHLYDGTVKRLLHTKE